MTERVSKLNDKQRRFVELVAGGRPAGRAYEEAGYSQRGASADQAASKMLAQPAIAAHHASLQKQSAAKAGISRDKLVEDLVTIWQSPPSAAAMDNPLCELVMTKAGPVAVFPDKGKVAERLCKLLGFDAPDKSESKIEIVLKKVW